MSAPEQARHVPPSLPQLCFEVPTSQVPLERQQPAHTVLSQTHWPFTQWRSAAQGIMVLPHTQRPAAEQRSLTPVRQSEQATPITPQFAAAEATQLPALQQPVGQVMAVQLAPHGPPSHAHAPAEQVCGEGQLAQLSPLLPQAVSVPPSRQVTPLQQPPHDAASQRQAPEAQRCPVWHREHTPPPLPHAAESPPPTHALSTQQPAHDCESHVVLGNSRTTHGTS